MKLNVHEHPLPSDESLAKVVVFELQCPQPFAFWRDCTWGILFDLGHHAEFSAQKPNLLLDEYDVLQPYMANSTRPRITLASTTKSFLKSHYATVRLPVPLEKVCLPCGLNLQLFDHRQKYWTAHNTGKPAFAPLCLDPIPTASPFAVLQTTFKSAAEANGPSPNEIIASQTRCPAQSAVSEYLAIQDIRSGQNTRWLRLLRELGSANINFGTETTTVLVSQSALTAGPNDNAGVHRSSHWVFTDEAFCHALSVQLEERLVNISANWHEGECMETLLTIMLRLHALATTPTALEEAKNLLMKSRSMLLLWMRGLRDEVRNATNADGAKRRSMDAFNAAILCRRTFNLELESQSLIMEPDSLSCFVECSITLKDNSPGDLSRLSKAHHAAWLRDLKIVHRLEPKLRRTIETFNESVTLGINALWPEPRGSPPREFAPWVFLPLPYTNLLTSTTVVVANTRQQTVHYDFIDGTLLVDGQALGKLAEKFSNEGLFKEVLGSVTRLKNGIVEIRPESTKWYPKMSNWKINLFTRRATRRESVLVDTRSWAFEQIAVIIEPFETRQEMLVYQPRNGGTTVSLPKLELSFYVNRHGLLQSRQLRAYIDSRQDAGTWYGLDSKLVLCDASNPRERSIIVPMAPVEVQKRGNHIGPISGRSGTYCRYNVNTILNRLDCPPEPRFIYYKALYHALTSFPLPDPLTGRTGTEEAIHCLASGYAQPWTPLDRSDVEILHCLGNLTPLRKYYPMDLKVMQNVKWNLELTSAAQSDEFFGITQGILAQSEKLSMFNLTKLDSSGRSAPASRGEQHLTSRARHHANNFVRASCDRNPPDDNYEPTVSSGLRARAEYVFETASLLYTWPSDLAVPQDLAGILQQWPEIGGYYQELNCVLLGDFLELDLALSWGAMFSFCQRATAKDFYKIIFMFSAISFGRNVDMDVMKAFIAFAIFADFRALVPPKWPRYVKFRTGQEPARNSLLQLIAPSRFPYAEDGRRSNHAGLTSKQRQNLRKREEKHALRVEEDCDTFVDHILDQWPCLEPSVKDLDQSLLLDVNQALEHIRPGWQALYYNRDLAIHIAEVSSILQMCGPGEDIIPRASSQKELTYWVFQKGCQPWRPLSLRDNFWSDSHQNQS